MRDPLTVAFEIKYPWKSKPNQFWPNGYRNTFITIWHKDPETDGTDDSCGWFKRSRHGDKEVLAKIIREFEFEWKYWFNKKGDPIYSVPGTVLNMFQKVAHVHYKNSWKKSTSFMKNNLTELLLLAENPADSLFPSITQQYGKTPKEDRIEDLASIIYGWILRSDRKWYQHPRWHIHHWRIQVHPLQSFKRRWIDKCHFCKGRFKNEEAYGNWSGDTIWHSRCEPGRVIKASSTNMKQPLNLPQQ